MKTLDMHVAEMRNLADLLADKSFPAGTQQDEEILSCLKQRELSIDGYDLIVYFNKCKNDELNLESLQIFGKYFSFLPFRIVCMLAVKFLGTKELSLTEVVHKNEKLDEYFRNIYVWSVYYKQGNPIANLSRGVDREYNGLKYSRVNSNQMFF